MIFSRRTFFRNVACGGAGFALGDLVDTRQVRAAAAGTKLQEAREVTTACNFCSCGCGIICHVKDGKLVNLEGDPDHIINRGALCAKGAALMEAHTSPWRLQKPRYRAPGSDRWQEVSWEEALNRIARKIQAIRDTTWIATEKVGTAEYTANRTDAIGFLGGAQNTNEECYLFAKMARLLGTAYVEHQARL